MLEKIDDLIESSQIHHTATQHTFVMVMFTVFQTHCLALKVSRPEYHKDLTLVVSNCWNEIIDRIHPFLLTEEEFEQAMIHLTRIVEAYQSYLETSD